VARLAAARPVLRDVVRHDPGKRWYTRLLLSGSVEVWLIGWVEGQRTGIHDHGGALGALAVAAGTVDEVVYDADLRHGQRRRHGAGAVVEFGPDHVHEVIGAGSATATTIHAYSPPGLPLRYMHLPQVSPAFPSAPAAPAFPSAPTAPTGPSRIDTALAHARSRLRRLTPHQAAAAATGGALLVDIRPAGQRAAEGGVPGALVVERNVLEWRLDPTSDARLDVATGFGVQVVLLCSEGYTSSLAAASLQELGLFRATDVVGGFHAWAAAGLPTLPPPQEIG
jgi:rhodanese-related sulfurtransferase